MKKIWLSSPHMGGNEQKYVQEAFDTNWIAPLGPNVDGFEREMAKYLSISSVAALSSGTAAIHLALILAGVQQNDYVLCQSFTFSASANPVLYQGAIPIFIDSERETWNICPVLLRDAIADCHKKKIYPKALIAVHLYGMPSQIIEIKRICDEFGIVLIEDAAEALGSSINDKKLGTYGHFGVFSFNGNKIITTSGGGALVSDSKEYVDYAKFLATQARDDAPHYQHSQIGYNYRMSNLCAGVGRGQLEVLQERIAQRRRNYYYYQESLKEYKIFFLQEPKGFFSNRWLSCVLFESFEVREQVRMGLIKENIESRPLWKPMHLQPVFYQTPNYVNGVSENLFNTGLCLPSGSNLIVEELERIVEVIKKIIYH
ncbi:DegT/DnrJ/EryC1/StrS aminotransferase [Emticicia oligotrophica DSM 17448]|uniref:DegT/DnrJ/EryC1/StrS aminotransferase n=1 Tax=Emticicia oligotrophica (strain DSM 17448 / CIP 109782 / MTCC 6937 / GPTSA100-15) TaxID=929562 RepID=A0ABM5N1G0_EMTOG|nr:DegT/DnrJ/EryC1/StrS family aminotransferase [Emticicia oligotrophica]AFK03210.1 DegT/DnrJ/EryC1/StrS aminotransferase [Emticicia oligotrophica DSM 17448]